MKHVGHFIAGELQPADDGSQIFNPSNGKPTAIAAIGTPAEVDRAVAAARAAFPAWSAQGLQNRATVMLELRGELLVQEGPFLGFVEGEVRHLRLTRRGVEAPHEVVVGRGSGTEGDLRPAHDNRLKGAL